MAAGARLALARGWGLGLLFLGASAASQAALFGDDEARRAILDLRQRIDALSATDSRIAEEQRRSLEEAVQLRRSLLDLQSQIEALREEQARMRGQNEQLLKELADLQKRQKDAAQGVEERLRRLEPSKVSLDGLEFQAEPTERRDFEAALFLFRGGKFPEAAQAFATFLRQYPRSAYLPSVRFWLGNAQYANRDYKEAVVNFRSLLSEAPQHARAPDAALAMANAQIEMKEPRAARKTLEDLLRNHPESNAADSAKAMLARLK